MENKKTTELLDLLKSLVDKEGNLKNGWEKAYDELLTREPFDRIFRNEIGNDGTMEDDIEDLKDKVKKLMRHKHYKNNDDVMIRI